MSMSPIIHSQRRQDIIDAAEGTWHAIRRYQMQKKCDVLEDALEEFEEIRRAQLPSRSTKPVPMMISETDIPDPLTKFG
jgi:hypothetical protein